MNPSLVFISLNLFGLVHILPFAEGKDSQTLIVGGEDAYPGEFPFLVGIWRDGKLGCGGSLIQEDVVLTAAHCVHLGNGQVWHPNGIVIVAGDHNSEVDEPTEQRMAVEKITAHPDFNWERNELIYQVNDVALIHLSAPFKLSERIQTISLPDATSASLPGGVVAGWGFVNDASPERPPILQKAQLSEADSSSCLEKYVNFGFDPSLQLCAGAEGRDICGGDDGGPFIVRSENTKTVYGIVSYGARACAFDEVGAMFTRVSAYVPWIQQELNKNRNNCSESTIIAIKNTIQLQQNLLQLLESNACDVIDVNK